MKISRRDGEMAFHCYRYHKPVCKFNFSNIGKTWPFEYIILFLKEWITRNHACKYLKIIRERYFNLIFFLAGHIRVAGFII